MDAVVGADAIALANSKLATRRQGTYLGTLEGVNHLDLVGWINTARYKWAEIMGREIKFKPATFYLGIADHLARVVEGQEQPHPDGESDAVRPEPERETSDERRDRERGEMADSLQKGESQAAAGTPSTSTSTASPRPRSVDGDGEADAQRPLVERAQMGGPSRLERETGKTPPS